MPYLSRTADTKEYASKAANQSISRMPLETAELLRSKLFRPVLVANELKDPIPMSTWVDHVRDNWNQWIQLDAADGGKLSGKMVALVVFDVPLWALLNGRSGCRRQATMRHLMATVLNIWVT